MKKQNILLIVAIVLVIVGFATPGLWPWQLPSVIFGSLLGTYALSNWKKI